MVQIKHIIISLALLVSTFAIAESVNETHSEHKEHTRFGMHGMVLITDGVDLYASHLPLYQSPHDYQILYLVESKHNDVFIKYLTQAKQDVELLYIQNMITLLPVGFDLNKLIAGNAFTIETQFFTGHFERGGQAWIKDKNFKFVRQVFKRSLSKIEYAATQDDNNWSLLTASNNKHQIMINNIHTALSLIHI